MQPEVLVHGKLLKSGGNYCNGASDSKIRLVPVCGQREISRLFLWISFKPLWQTCPGSGLQLLPREGRCLIEPIPNLRNSTKLVKWSVRHPHLAGDHIVSGFSVVDSMPEYKLRSEVLAYKYSTTPRITIGSH